MFECFILNLFCMRVKCYDLSHTFLATTRCLDFTDFTHPQLSHSVTMS